MTLYTKIDEIRFWSNVRVTNRKSCWYWQKNHSHPFGYGCFRINGQTYSAHRLALIFYSGEKDGFVLHSCDNPLCCNPLHLRWGTANVNTHDAMKRGRHVKPPVGHNPPVRYGEDNNLSKINYVIATKIREKYREGQSVRDISKEFNLSISTIYQIINLKTWKHVGRK